MFTITIDPVNDAPVANNDTYSTAEDTTLNEPAITGVLANDTDIETDPLTATLITPPGSAASFTLNPDGSFDYTPLTNFNGIDTFTYRAYDGNDFSTTATATITVTPTNDPPVLDPVGSQVIDEQTLLTFVATASDVDAGDVLTFSLSGEPGGASITTGGVFTWTPTETQGPGVYTFDVVVTDDGTPTLADTETITVTVNETNQAPAVTNPGNQTNAEADSVLLAVTGTDADVPANTLTWSATGLPTGLGINAGTGQISGTIAYSAAAGSPWTVTVTATDDGAPNLQDAVVFTWTVTNTNRAPTANDDAYPVDEDQALGVAAPGVLGNDTDLDADPLTAVLVTPPSQAATFMLNPDGSFTYIPTSNWNGIDTFTYRATDATDPSNIATVTITVNPVNDDPVANDDSRGTPEDIAIVIDVLTNDTDVESDPLSIDSFTQGSNGTVTDNGDGTLTYTPNPNWNGVDTFTYTATDGNGGFGSATVTVTVGVVNDPPVANDDTYGTNEDTPVVADVLTNDTDVEGDALSVDSFTQGSNGTVADNGDGTLTYTPNANWNGVDTFTYQASDATDPSNSATVTVTVAPTNDAPTLDPVGNRLVDEQTLLSFTATGSDIDTADTLIFSLAGAPTGASINPASGLFTWTPSEAQGPGAYTFDVVVTDSGTPSLGDAETITITVNETNRAPIVTNPGSQANAEAASVLLAVTAGDPDIPVNTLTWSATGLPVGLSINPTNGQISGTVDYSASAGSPYTVTVTATDDGTPNLADSVVFTWVITNTNRAPIALPDSASTPEDSSVTIAVLANDFDPDLDAISVLATTQPANGTVVNGGGDVTYTPDPDWFGVDTFDVTVTDGTDTSVASVTVTVGPVNDTPVLDPIGNQTGVEQTLITFTATASDIDVADTLTFRLVGEPTGASINPVTGVFTWTPTEMQGPATYTFDVAVDDNGTPVRSATRDHRGHRDRGQRRPCHRSDCRLQRCGANRHDIHGDRHRPGLPDRATHLLARRGPFRRLDQPGDGRLHLDAERDSGPRGVHLRRRRVRSCRRGVVDQRRRHRHRGEPQPGDHQSGRSCDRGGLRRDLLRGGERPRSPEQHADVARHRTAA